MKEGRWGSEAVGGEEGAALCRFLTFLSAPESGNLVSRSPEVNAEAKQSHYVIPQVG